jgi:hypothetical protein
MPSNAYNDHLVPLLLDAEELDAAHATLRAGTRGRPIGLSALNRAAVVICVSAWEAFIEELARESLEAIRPAAPPMGTWPALNASVRGAIGRFNTPNTDQIRILFSDAIGLQDIQNHWTWPGCTPAQARARLQRAMDYRHAVAHGVNPRPAVDNRFSNSLIKFFRRLGRCTDAAVRQYLVSVLGITHPWPA